MTLQAGSRHPVVEISALHAIGGWKLRLDGRPTLLLRGAITVGTALNNGFGLPPDGLCVRPRESSVSGFI